MYADVVVLTYQSPEIKSYTYQVPEDLQKAVKTGQLVQVPFGTRNPLGVILETGDWKLPARLAFDNSKAGGETEKQIKFISLILSPTPILLPHQIELLKWLSFYYHSPMVNCLKAMLPTAALNAQRLTTNADNIYSQSFSHSALSVNQTIILVPTLNRLPETLAKYRQAKEYAVYHNELKPSERFNTWLKIASGSVDFIFGSRSAIFVPTPKLAKIIIYDEHDGAYKDERSPYFDTLTVAEKLQSLTGARLQIIDDAPKITTYFNNRPALTINYPPKNPKVRIVSMIDQRKTGNRTPVSDVLSAYLNLAFKKSKTALLFLNKKAESGSLYCRNCKYHDFVQSQPETCPNCLSSDILFSSTNIRSLASYIQKLITGTQIRVIGKGQHLPATSYLTPGIDIATATVFYRLSPKKYDLVAHIFADSLLNRPDYKSEEKTYTQIDDLKKLTKNLLIIQTYNPDSPTIKTAADSDYQKFFQYQIDSRKALFYPPFSLLVKLTVKSKKLERLEQKGQKLFEDLVSQSTNDSKQTVTVLGPYQSVFTQKLPSYNIILKTKLADYSLAAREKALDKLKSYLAQVPRDWQIIAEPESIN